MSVFTLDDQWRSFQTFLAAYLAGMLHPRDVLTISRRSAAMPPLVEFRCDGAGDLWFDIGAGSWSDEQGASVQVSRREPDLVSAQTVALLRAAPNLDEPSELRPADIDVEGDVIDAAARTVGARAFEGTKSGSIASMAFAAELARLRNWIDPFSSTPKTGYLVGGQSPQGSKE